MWTVPSRGRPHNLGRLIAACRATGMTTSALVLVDDDDPCLAEYRAVDWPLMVGKRGPLSDLYNAAFRAFPDRAYYGFLADDVVPETKGWDWRLIDVAGRDGMAVPSGGETTGGCPHFVLGGDLVRSVGWLCLPGLYRIFIDTVWKNIATERGVYRPVPDVVLQHHHFSNGKALFDRTYRKPDKARDRAIYHAWKDTR